MNKKVFVSGCYDLLHSGHVEFFNRRRNLATYMWALVLMQRMKSTSIANRCFRRRNACLW